MMNWDSDMSDQSDCSDTDSSNSDSAEGIGRQSQEAAVERAALECAAAKRAAKSAELREHTVAQLKSLCAQHGLRKTGAKAELVARLCDALCTEFAGGEASH